MYFFWALLLFHFLLLIMFLLYDFTFFPAFCFTPPYLRCFPNMLSWNWSMSQGDNSTSPMCWLMVSTTNSTLFRGFQHGLSGDISIQHFNHVEMASSTQQRGTPSSGFLWVHFHLYLVLHIVYFCIFVLYNIKVNPHSPLVQTFIVKTTFLCICLVESGV